MKHFLLGALPGLFAIAFLLGGATASALDPFCDPNDSGAGIPHDPAQLYERPNRDIHFCSSLTPASIGPIFRCVFTVDGVPYASVPDLLPGTEVTISSPGVAAGTMEGRCSYPGVDANGDPATIVSAPMVLQYVPAPEPSAPVFH